MSLKQLMRSHLSVAIATFGGAAIFWSMWLDPGLAIIAASATLAFIYFWEDLVVALREYFES